MSVSRALALVLVTPCVVLAAATQGAAAQEAAAPSVLSVRLADSSSGRGVQALSVRAAGRGSPVSGMVANFGGVAGFFGLSSCRATDSPRRGAGAPFGPRSRVALSAPHTFGNGTARPVAVRLDSGGCERVGPSLVQPLTVMPRRPGESRRQVLLGTPVELPEPGALPDLGSFPNPGTLPAPGAPQLPGGQGPGLPELPRLPAFDPVAADAARHRPRCRGAGRRPGPSRASRRRSARRSVCLINVERARRGLRPLRRNRRLTRAARAHARAMVRGGYFSHVQPGGIDLARRLSRVSYIDRRRRWEVGENLGFGQGRLASPRELVASWMRSTTHRATILDPRFREVGVGAARGLPIPGRHRGTTYAADFGTTRR